MTIHIDVNRYATEPEALREHLRKSWTCDIIVRRDSWTVFGPDLDPETVRQAVEQWADGEGVEALPDPVEAFHAALDAATTLDEVKAALKGSASAPGAEPRRGSPARPGS